MTNYWSKSEVDTIVEDYFNMLRLELVGQKYNKTEHRRALKRLLNQRSDGSVELKHQNISAALIDMGMPYIGGYKPRFNYQRSVLPKAISEYLANHPEIKTLIQTDVDRVPQVPSIKDFLAVLAEPPAKNPDKPTEPLESRPLRTPLNINYLEREAQNQLLGDAGELFVMNFERARLIHAGKDSLAERIEQVSITVGPSAGFDIRSFEDDGTDRFIEAKTTKYGKHTPFYVTSNELAFSQRNAGRYYLYRVFGFRTEPHLFSLQGSLQDHCVLQPTQYMAKL